MQLKFSFVLLLIFVSTQAYAAGSSWREKLTFHVGAGLGDNNLSKTVLEQDTFLDASRSESPLIFKAGVEANIAHNWSLSLRHSRGVKMSPFSSGVSFTGLVLRRYFLNSQPYIPPTTSNNSVTMRNWAPYVGVGGGLAFADTSREREVISEVEGSGTYLGFHLGLDYHMYEKLILRPELVYSTTLFDDTERPATITEMGLTLSLVFRI